MKRIGVALLVGTLIVSVLAGLTYLSSANALGGAFQVAASTPAASVVPTVAPAFEGELTEDVMPIRENVDPVLGDDDWGIRSSRVKGAKGQDVTGDAHVAVEDYEDLLLSQQQSKELRKVFKNADGVRRLIEKYDGDPDDDTTQYYTLRVHADEDDSAPNTPWVTATLRADFYSPEGMRAIEMEVYRKKTDKGELDNTPYVAQTQIGYIDRGAPGARGVPLSTTLGYRHEDGAEFPIAHDTLETIYYEN